MRPDAVHSRLSSGLKLSVQPIPDALATSSYLWFDAGSVDEPEDRAGMAHFLEHMLFKGTASRGIGQAAAEIEGVGGDLNAYTSYDQTVLHATVDASSGSHALEVLVDMARHSTLDPEEVQREKRVVTEEIRSYRDDPDSVASDALQALMFDRHPYARPVLGSVETVAAIDAGGLGRHLRAHYGAGRAIMGVAGPVDPAEVARTLEALTADWPVGVPRDRVPLARVPSRKLHRLDAAFDTAVVHLGWRVPPLGHPDLPALDVLCTALGVGSAALLTEVLQLDDGIASAVWVDLSPSRGGGALAAGFLPSEGETGAAIARATHTLAEVARHGLSGRRVARARNAIAADYLFGAETVDGVAHDLVWYRARYGDPGARARYRAAVAAVTADDVRRVARAWLDPEAMFAVAVDPDLTARGLERSAIPAGPSPRPRPRRGAAQVHTLPNGARLALLPDDTPVAAAKLLALGGGLAQRARTAGIASAWARMITSGAGPLDVVELGQAVDDVAGTLDGVVGRNTIGVAATFPSEHLLDGLELVGHVVTEPWFEREDWDRVRDELLEEVRTLDDRPGQVASRALWRALWRGHPWRLPLSGTASTLGSITPRALATWHRGQMGGANVVLAVAGGFDPDAVRAAVADWLGGLEAREGLAPRPEPGPVRRRPVALQAGREQLTLTLAVRGARVTDPERHALQVAAAILGAQSGRLFMELREARGLAYSVWASSTEGLDGGLFALGLSTDPEREDEARTALVAELRALTEVGPTPEEVQRITRMLAGQAAMGLQRAGARAAELASAERFGLPRGLEAYRQALAAVEPAHVRDALRRIGADQPIEIAVRPR